MLTDKQLKALKQDAPRHLLTDGNGLSLDVQSSGLRSWIFRYRLNGRQETVTLGRYPALSLADARKKRNSLQKLVDDGKSPAAEKREKRAGRSTEPTMMEFGDRYYNEQVAPNLKDPSEVRRYLDNEIYPVLGNRLLKDIGVLDCQRLIHRKRDKGRIITALRLRAALKQVFDYAVELQLVTSNPAAQVSTRYIGKTSKRTRALSPKEIRVFLNTLDEADIQRQFKLALRITLFTLTRKSELRLAEWKDVDLNAGIWLVPAANTKTNADHVVYLSVQVAAMFRELQVLACGSEYVLPGRSSIHKPMHENSLNAALNRITFDGVAPFTIHDLRRTASTILHGKKFQPDVIEVALGHKVGGIRGTYNVQQYEAERRKMLAWWAKHIDELVTGSNLVEGNFGA